jgi:hypothetical protein
MQRKQSGVEKKRIICKRLPVLHTGCSKPNNIEQVMGKLVALSTLIGDGEMILFPSLIEQRNHSMVEKI